MHSGSWGGIRRKGIPRPCKDIAQKSHRRWPFASLWQIPWPHVASKEAGKCLSAVARGLAKTRDLETKEEWKNSYWEGKKKQNNNFILLVLLATQYVRVFPHAHQFSETSWVSCNLTQFCNCSSGDGIRPHRLRAQSHKVASPTDATPKARVLTCASDDPLAVNQKFPQPSSWAWYFAITSLQNSGSLLFDHFIMERYNCWTVKW